VITGLAGKEKDKAATLKVMLSPVLY